MPATNRDIEKIRAALQNQNQLIQDLQRKINEQEAEKFIAEQIEIQSQLFDKAASYNTVVVSLGYAGLLSIWAWGRDRLNDHDAVILVAMLGLSLMIFVFWTVLSQFILSRHHIKRAEILGNINVSGSQKLKQLTQYDQAAKQRSLRFLAAWYWIFLAASLLGFISGIFLVALLLANLFWPEASLTKAWSALLSFIM